VVAATWDTAVWSTAVWGTAEGGGEPPPAQYYLVNASAGAGGSINPYGTFNILVGATFTSAALADEGYTFTQWLLAGNPYSLNPVLSINPSYVSAWYFEAQFTVTVPVEPPPPPPPVPDPTYFSVNIGVAVGGTTSPTGVQNTLTTATLSVTATASPTYTFDSWFKNGATDPETTNTIVLSGAASETITLLPVFRYVPPTNPPIIPTGTIVGTSTGYIERILDALEQKELPSIDDVFNVLEQVMH
jgi:hypothetical protein